MEELERLLIEATSETPPEAQSYEQAACSEIAAIDLPPAKLAAPESRPISQEQLVNEVKGIYTGLLLVERKCIETYLANSKSSSTELNNEQWQALVALQRMLLREHEDFLLASHHPLASEALRKLALRHDLPGRLWRNGNKAFLEILRHRIPEHLENMIAYIYLSFDMLTRLDAKFPDLGERWAECMQDLETYRDFLETFRVNQPDDDNALAPSSVAYQHLADCYENGESSRRNEDDSYNTSRPRQTGVQQDCAFSVGRDTVNWLFGTADADSGDPFSRSSPPNDSLRETADDETNVQEEFDSWFGDLNPNVFDREGKNKWVLLGWLHFGKHIARSFWSYRRVFRVLLLNVLL
ncbi:hypothetical protein CLAIMM_06641 [Cladophialophora immunda]|nr:hypothetical protein CLAIMM_06641 [Cladophialophora immunda]